MTPRCQMPIHLRFLRSTDCTAAMGVLLDGHSIIRCSMASRQKPLVERTRNSLILDRCTIQNQLTVSGCTATTLLLVYCRLWFV